MHKSEEVKRLQGKTGTQILIVGETTVKDMKGLWIENMRDFCFLQDMVPDMRGGTVGSVAENPLKKTI